MQPQGALIAFANGELDGESGVGELAGGAVGPFDDEHAALCFFPQTKLGELDGAREAVEVGVEEAFAAGVLVDEHEGGAGDGALAAETAGDALGEARLAASEIAAEQEDVAGAEAVAEALAEVAGRVFAVGRDGGLDGGSHDWSSIGRGAVAPHAWGSARKASVRIALLSDIHANLVALDAVLADAEARGAGDVRVLGDSVGYGPQPNEVVSRLMEAGALAVLGNHDAVAIGKMGTEWFNARAAAAAEWTREQMQPEQRAWLAGLEEVAQEGDWSFVHGTLRDPLREYLLSDEAATAHFERQETPYSAVGHTHLPMLVWLGEEGVIAWDRPATDEATVLDEDLLCVNPGSVGQPRDGDPHASYAILDQEAGCVTHHRVAYAIEVTQERIEAAGLPYELAERLAFGR